MDRQKEQLTLNDKVKFDNKNGAILGVLEGPVADFQHPTRNGRLYSEKLWDNVLKNPLVMEQFKNGGIVGELDHPADRDDICTEKVAIIMPEPPVKKNGQYYGKFNILDTPCGRIVYTLAKAGFKLGVSSRGTGDVNEYTDEVDPSTYEFTCFDVVLLPAVESARMKLVTESLDTKKFDYKKLLREDLNNANEKDKAIMEDTLNHLNDKLNEGWDDLLKNVNGDKYVDPATGKESKQMTGIITKKTNKDSIDPQTRKSIKQAEKELDNLNKAESKFKADGEEVLKNIENYTNDIVALAQSKLQDYPKYQPMLDMDLDPSIQETVYSKLFITKRDLIDTAQKYSKQWLLPYSPSNTTSVFTNNAANSYNPYQLKRSEAYQRALDKVIDLYEEKGIDKGVEMAKQLKTELSSLDESLDSDKICVICHKPFEGYGNNAEPVAEGRCCDECNAKVVIPARIEEINKHKKLDEAKEKDEAEEAQVEPQDDASEDKIISPETMDDIEIEEKENSEPCQIDDAKLIELLHKFLEGEGLELDGEGEEEQHFIDLFHEIVCPECAVKEPEDGLDNIKDGTAQDEEPEVGDSESSELVAQVQDLLKENGSLKEELKTLQAEKAVSGAKVSRLNEELNNFKSVAANAGKKALEYRNLETKTSSLREAIESLKESVAESNKEVELQSAKISQLTEAKEDLLNKFNALSSENKKLKEKLQSTETNSTKQLTESSKKIAKAKKLIEQYKGLAHQNANRYIELKARGLGISKNEILNRLNESYTLDDVDSVCDDLKEYSLNISTLPFAFDKPGSAKVRIREDRSKDPLNKMDSQYDDTVDDYLLELAGLK